MAVIAAVYVFAYGLTNQNISGMIAVTDGDNKACDTNDGGYKYLFYSLATNQSEMQTKRICVKACPASASDTVEFRATTAVPANTAITEYPTEVFM